MRTYFALVERAVGTTGAVDTTGAMGLCGKRGWKVQWWQRV